MFLIFIPGEYVKIKVCENQGLFYVKASGPTDFCVSVRSCTEDTKINIKNLKFTKKPFVAYLRINKTSSLFKEQKEYKNINNFIIIIKNEWS